MGRWPPRWRAAKFSGLDAAGMDALGIAYCRVSFTGNSTVSPSLTKRLGIGFASHSGVLAALLAAAGFPGAGELFQGKGGYYNFFFRQEGDYDLITDQLAGASKSSKSDRSRIRLAATPIRR